MGEASVLALPPSDPSVRICFTPGAVTSDSNFSLPDQQYVKWFKNIKCPILISQSHEGNVSSLLTDQGKMFEAEFEISKLPERL
jgi:hypothetical protein